MLDYLKMPTKLPKSWLSAEFGSVSAEIVRQSPSSAFFVGGSKHATIDTKPAGWGRQGRGYTLSAWSVSAYSRSRGYLVAVENVLFGLLVKVEPLCLTKSGADFRELYYEKVEIRDNSSMFGVSGRWQGNPGIQGRHADLIIIDDPFEKVSSNVRVSKNIHWWFKERFSHKALVPSGGSPGAGGVRPNKLLDPRAHSPSVVGQPAEGKRDKHSSRR